MHRVLVLVLAVLALAGCTAPAAAPPATHEIAITLADGAVDPSGGKVDVARGDTVVLLVTSDRADTIHVHGYDLEFDIDPGGTARVEFVADNVGRYEIESHDPALLILQLQVR